MATLDELNLSTSAYLADTQHLSLPQHGAYLLILMTMRRAKGWIRDDDHLLANICKLSVPKWKKIAPEIRALLIERDGNLSQKRLLSEVEIDLKTISKNVENGRAGGLAKALKNKTSGVASATLSLGSRQPHEVLPTVFSEDLESKKEKKKSTRGSTLPSDWQPISADRDYGLRLGLTDVQIDSALDDMRMWAKANANRAVARKADWSATFRNWMKREASNCGPRTPRRGGAWAKMAAEAAEEV